MFTYVNCYCFQIWSLCGSSLWSDHVATSDAYGLLADVSEFIMQQLSGTANVLVQIPHDFDNYQHNKSFLTHFTILYRLLRIDF